MEGGSTTSLNSVGRTLLNASLRAAMKPLRSGLTALFKSALASGDGDATALAKGGVIARGPERHRPLIAKTFSAHL